MIYFVRCELHRDSSRLPFIVDSKGVAHPIPLRSGVEIIQAGDEHWTRCKVVSYNGPIHRIKIPNMPEFSVDEDSIMVQATADDTLKLENKFYLPIHFDQEAGEYYIDRAKPLPPLYLGEGKIPIEWFCGREYIRLDKIRVNSGGPTTAFFGEREFELGQTSVAVIDPEVSIYIENFTFNSNGDGRVEKQDLPVPADKVRVGESGAKRSTDVDHVAYHLIHPIFLRRMAKVMAEGKRKYGAYNWMKGFPIGETLDHLVEHLMKYQEADTSEDHLGHAACNLMFIMVFDAIYPELAAKAKYALGGKASDAMLGKIDTTIPLEFCWTFLEKARATDRLGDPDHLFRQYLSDCHRYEKKWLEWEDFKSQLDSIRGEGHVDEYFGIMRAEGGQPSYDGYLVAAKNRKWENPITKETFDRMVAEGWEKRIALDQAV